MRFAFAFDGLRYLQLAALLYVIMFPLIHLCLLALLAWHHEVFAYLIFVTSDCVCLLSMYLVSEYHILQQPRNTSVTYTSPSSLPCCAPYFTSPYLTLPHLTSSKANEFSVNASIILPCLLKSSLKIEITQGKRARIYCLYSGSDVKGMGIVEKFIRFHVTTYQVIYIE